MSLREPSSADVCDITATPPQSDTDREQARTRSQVHADGFPTFPGYRVLKMLGKGGYGQVWLAESTVTKKQVAIKEFANLWHAERQVVEAEVQQLGQLAAKPGIIGIEGANLDANPPFFIMPYCDGKPLSESVTEHGLPVDKALRIFEQIIESMTYVHSAGVIHCDIKPANVLLDRECDRPWIIDFGQARHLARGSQKVALGTLFYMAPDQITEEATFGDTRWDVYSLGATFHFLLTGHPPHRDAEVIRRIETQRGLREQLAIYRQHLESAPAPTEHRRLPGVDSLLADIVDKCLQMDPQRRYSSAGHIREALLRRDEKLARRHACFPANRDEAGAGFVPIARGPLPVPLAVDAFGLVVKSLAEAHNRGVVHGHLQVENLLFHRREQCLIGDWSASSVAPVPETLGGFDRDARDTFATPTAQSLSNDRPIADSKTAAPQPQPMPVAASDDSEKPAPMTVIPAPIPTPSMSSSPASHPSTRPHLHKDLRRRFVNGWLHVVRRIRDAKIRMFPRQVMTIAEPAPTPETASAASTTTPSAPTPSDDVKALGVILKGWLLGPAESPHRATPYKATLFGREAFHYLEIPAGDGQVKYRPLDIHLWTMLQSCLTAQSNRLCNSADDVARMLQVRASRLRQNRVLRGFLFSCMAILATFCLVLGVFLWLAIDGARHAMNGPLHEGADVAAAFFGKGVESHLKKTERFLVAHSRDTDLGNLLDKAVNAADKNGPLAATPSPELLEAGKKLEEHLQAMAADDAKVPESERTYEKFKSELCLKFITVLDARGRILGSVNPGERVEKSRPPFKYFYDFSGREYFNGQYEDYRHIRTDIKFGGDGRPVVPKYSPIRKIYISRPFSNRANRDGLICCISVPIVREGRTVGVLLTSMDHHSFKLKMDQLQFRRQAESQTRYADFAIFAPADLKSPKTESHKYDHLIYCSRDKHGALDAAVEGDNWDKPESWHRIELWGESGEVSQSESDDIWFARTTLDGDKKHLAAVHEVRFKDRDAPGTAKTAGTAMARPGDKQHAADAASPQAGELVWKVAVLLPSDRADECVRDVRWGLIVKFIATAAALFFVLVAFCLYFGYRIRKEERNLYA